MHHLIRFELSKYLHNSILKALLSFTVKLEMWQKETFDPALIRREVTLASSLGFNTLRVYLHDLVWTHDGDAFLQRLDQFLGIANDQKMKTIFVLFDDCHRPDPVYGKQPKPVKGVHNSVWKQSPVSQTVLPLQNPLNFHLCTQGAAVVRKFHDGSVSELEVTRLKAYVTTVIRRFASDSRVLMWDLYNEPGNSGMGNKSFQLLQYTWDWAQAVRPSQPLVGHSNCSPLFISLSYYQKVDCLRCWFGRQDEQGLEPCPF